MTPESTPLPTPVASPFATPEATPLPLPVFDAPAGSGVPWGDVLSALSIILGLAYWWAGRRKIELTGYWKPLTELLDAALIGAGVVLLGWPIGPILFVGTNVLLAIIKAIGLAMQHDEILARAAAVSHSTKPQMKALAKWLPRQHEVFRYLGPIRTAKLIDHLSDAARTIRDIEAMAPPIAHLWVMDRPDMGKFVADFDRLMRLWRKPASEATAVADTIAAAAQVSPMTIQETIDGLIAVADPYSRRDRGGQPELDDSDPDEQTARGPE